VQTGSKLPAPARPLAMALQGQCREHSMTAEIIGFASRPQRSAADFLTNDEAFLAAEGLIAVLLAESGTIDDDERDREIVTRIARLQEAIAESPPLSFVSVAVKLRVLCDPEIGMEVGPRDDDFTSLRQIRDFVEREARP
jgi:hypothetical protein